MKHEHASRSGTDTCSATAINDIKPYMERESMRHTIQTLSFHSWGPASWTRPEPFSGCTPEMHVAQPLRMVYRQVLTHVDKTHYSISSVDNPDRANHTQKYSPQISLCGTQLKIPVSTTLVEPLNCNMQFRPPKWIPTHPPHLKMHNLSYTLVTIVTQALAQHHAKCSSLMIARSHLCGPLARNRRCLHNFDKLAFLEYEWSPC